MKHEKSCGAVVFTRVNGEIRYALIEQHGRVFGFPKGHVEGNETEKETALREIHEEVRLVPRFIEGFRETEEYILPGEEEICKTVVYFLAEYAGQEIVIQPEELAGAPVVSYEEAMELLQFDGKKRILKAANDFLLNAKTDS